MQRCKAVGQLSIQSSPAPLAARLCVSHPAKQVAASDVVIGKIGYGSASGGGGPGAALPLICVWELRGV